MLLECFGPLKAGLLEVCSFDGSSTLAFISDDAFKGDYSCAATARVHGSRPRCGGLRHSSSTHNAIRSSATQGLCQKSFLSLYEGVGDKIIYYFKIL